MNAWMDEWAIVDALVIRMNASGGGDADSNDDSDDGSDDDYNEFTVCVTVYVILVGLASKQLSAIDTAPGGNSILSRSGFMNSTVSFGNKRRVTNAILWNKRRAPSISNCYVVSAHIHMSMPV